MQDRPLVAHSIDSPILALDEPPPVAVHNADANSPFLLLGDHAGNRIPASLDQLGLDRAERERHIGWDIGIADLGICLADRLGASFIHQIYSRLVIDCNRRPGAADSIPPVSDGTAIPGNEDIDAQEAERRVAAIHDPYQEAIRKEIDRRSNDGLPTFLVALHSFTPSMNGRDRPWHAGILYDAGDNRFARAVLSALADFPELNVGDNEPYSMDTIDFTIPFHAYPRALPYVEIEIRQDLLQDDRGIQTWCARLEHALPTARRSYRQLTR